MCLGTQRSPIVRLLDMTYRDGLSGSTQQVMVLTMDSPNPQSSLIRVCPEKQKTKKNGLWLIEMCRLWRGRCRGSQLFLRRAITCVKSLRFRSFGGNGYWGGGGAPPFFGFLSIGVDTDAMHREIMQGR